MRRLALAVAAAALGAVPAAAPPARAAGPVPAIETILPSKGPEQGGTAVTVTGTNFAAPMEVIFGGTPGTQVVVQSPTSLTVVTPAHARGAVTVSVSQTSPPRTDSAPFANGFTFRPAPCYLWVPRANGSATGGNPGGFDITIVDAANREVAGSLDLNVADAELPTDDAWRPSQVLFPATGDYAFVATAGTPGTLDSRKIFVVKTARAVGAEEGAPVVAVIDTGGNPTNIALSSTGNSLYAADAGSWKDSAILLPNGKFRGWDVSDRASPVAFAGTPATVGILPVISYAPAAYQGWGTNSSFKGTVQSKSSKCVVTNAGSRTLSVVDTGSLALLATEDVGVPGGGLLQITTSVPSPYSDDFVFVQTTDLTDPENAVTEYFVYRISTGDLLDKGAVATPMLFFQMAPAPDLTNRLAWPHPDGSSMVTVPSGESAVASWIPATGAAPRRTAIPGGGPPTALGYNDVKEEFYAREADGGWTVLSVPDSTSGNAAPVVVTSVADANGVNSIRVFGDGSEMAGTAASILAIVDAATTGTTARTVVATVALPLNPTGGGVFPQPGPNCGAARTFVEAAVGGGGPEIIVPLGGSEFCSGEDPPTFEFDGTSEQFRRYELELGSQYDFIVGPGAKTVRQRLPADDDTVVPTTRNWLAVLRAAAGDSERPFYARVNGVRFDGSRSYGDTVALRVCAVEPCEAVAPADNTAATADASPEFSFLSHGAAKAWIELAGPGGFEDGRLLRFRVPSAELAETTTVAVPDRSWRRVVAKARRIEGGGPTSVAWRVRCIDDLLRETLSAERILNVP